jgi:hypothetical protein
MLFARSGPIGFLSHLRSLRRYDEPEILHFSLIPICLANADAGQPQPGLFLGGLLSEERRKTGWMRA